MNASSTRPSSLTFRTWCREWFASAKLRSIDWAVLIFLAVALALMEAFAQPFERHIAPEDWDSIRYPLKSDTVPAWTVPIYGLLLPIIFFVVYHFVQNCEVREFHDLFLIVCYNLIATALVTDLLKETLGRLRPNYFERFEIQYDKRYI